MKLKLHAIPTLIVLLTLLGSGPVAAQIYSPVNKEVVDVWAKSEGCELYFRKFDDNARHYRVFLLTNVLKKSDCTLQRPEIEQLSFGAIGVAGTLPTTLADDVVIKKTTSIPHSGREIPIFGDPIPGLKDKAMSSCDSASGLCQGDITVAFYNARNQHVYSNHRMLIFQKDMALKDTPVKNSAKRLFPSGVVPAGTLLQRIRTNVEWISGGAFQADSCNALWIGENTLQKPAKVNWGCGAAKAAWEVKYRIL